MSTTPAIPADPTQEQPVEGLRKDAIGLTGAMMLGVVIMAPSLAIFFNWGFMVPSVGVATGIVFVIALVMSIPTAYSYALINSRMPAAGATYKWASRLINPRVGIAMGLCTTLYYVLFIPAEVPFMALVGSDLARSTSTTFFGVLMGASLLIAIPLVYRGIAFNIDTSIVLVTIEVIIVMAVAVGAFIASSSSHVSLAPLHPGNIPSTSALIPALVLGVGSFTGYDAISTLADETRTARRLIPKATILAVIVVGLFWVLMSTILSNALPPSAYNKAIEEGGFPLAAAAGTAFGSAGRDVIDIMGIEAGFALLIAASIGSTRILYAMGRDGAISRRFGTVNSKFHVPWYAISWALATAVVVEVALSIYVGVNFNITLWLVNLAVFFAIVTYLVINACNPLLFFKHFRSEFSWFSNGLVPLIGLAVTGWFMYEGFFNVLLEAEEFKFGGSIVIVAITLFILTILASFWLARDKSVRDAARSHDDEDPLEEEEVRDLAGADGSAG